MRDLSEVRLCLRNHRCFRDEWHGFDGIAPLNVLIGRNNAGKSSLLSLVETVTSLDSRGGKKESELSEVLVAFKLSEEDVKKVYQPRTTGGKIRYSQMDHWEYGQRYLGGMLTMVLRPGAPQRSARSFVSVTQGGPDRGRGSLDDDLREELASVARLPFERTRYRLLAGERDLIPERVAAQWSFRADGSGATDLFRRYAHEASLDHEVVENVLLGDMNQILQPDAEFTRLKVQQVADERWEVFLGDERDGLIPASACGQGLKTVLLMLAMVHLVPKQEKAGLSDYFFGFEELENNLHPALQRRLFGFLRDFATKHGCHFFLTTHSNVVIDLFAGDEAAQILHVTQHERVSRVEKVELHAHRAGILETLGFHASDLLQANGVIWVEGPSDRIYVRRWIDLVTGGELEEGRHYMFMYTGGAMLAHYTAAEPDDLKEVPTDQLIRFLRANRNAALVGDSDRRSSSSPLKPRLRRLQRELEDSQQFCWVTCGRETENYIPKRILESLLKTTFDRRPKRYASIPSLAAKTRGVKNLSKVEFANEVAGLFQLSDLDENYGLRRKAENLCRVIRKWNGLTSEVQPD